MDIKKEEEKNEIKGMRLKPFPKLRRYSNLMDMHTNDQE
jgi:hypothetical protein